MIRSGKGRRSGLRSSSSFGVVWHRKKLPKVTETKMPYYGAAWLWRRPYRLHPLKTQARSQRMQRVCGLRDRRPHIVESVTLRHSCRSSTWRSKTMGPHSCDSRIPDQEMTEQWLGNGFVVRWYEIHIDGNTKFERTLWLTFRRRASGAKAQRRTSFKVKRRNVV